MMGPMSLGSSMVTETLSKHLDKFFQDISADQLHFHLWRGKVSLSNVKLKTSLWNSLVSPFGLLLKQGTVGSIEFSLFQSQSSLSITLKGLHLVFKPATLEESIFSESVVPVLSSFEYSETLSMWKAELGSFLASLVSLTIEDVKISLEYFQECSKLILVMDRLQVFGDETDSVPLDNSSEGNIDLGLSVSKAVLLHQLEISYVDHPHGLQKTLFSLASCRLECNAVIQAQAFCLPCSIVFPSSLQFHLDFDIIESLWTLFETCQEYQRMVDKWKAKQYILRLYERSSLIEDKWKWITHFIIIHIIRPKRKYYCIYRACCFRWLRLQLLRDKFEDYEMSLLQIVFLQRMERLFPKQCMEYLQHCRQMAASMMEQASLYVFSLLDEEHLRRLFTSACFFQSSSFHPLLSRPTIALTFHLEQGIDIHLQHTNLDWKCHIGRCNVEWLSSEKEDKFVLDSCHLSLNSEISSPSIRTRFISSDNNTFSSWIQLEYRMEHEEPFSGYLNMELCGIQIILQPELFKYFRSMTSNDFFIKFLKDSSNQLVLNSLAVYQPRSCFDYFRENGSIMMKLSNWDIFSRVASNEYSMEGLRLFFNTLELQRLNTDSLSNSDQFISMVDNLCIVSIWDPMRTAESRTLVQFVSPIEFTLSTDEETKQKNLECVFDELQVSMLSEDWLLLWHCLQEDYQLINVPVEIQYPNKLPCCQLEWKRCNIRYENNMLPPSFSFSSLSIELYGQCFVLLQSNHEEYYNGFRISEPYCAMLSLQYIYLNIYPVLKLIECMRPLSTSTRYSVEKTSRPLDWILGQVMIEKLEIGYSYSTCIPYHLMLERIRFTCENKQKETGNLSVNEMPWRLVIFSIRLFGDRKEYDVATPIFSIASPLRIAFKRDDYHSMIYFVFSPIRIQITMQDIESWMDGILYAMQTWKPWISNRKDVSKGTQSSPLSISLQVDMEAFHFHWILSGNEELSVVFQQFSVGYYGDYTRMEHAQEETSFLLSGYHSMNRLWLQLPYLSIQAKDSSHMLFSLECNSIVYNPIVGCPFELLEIAEWKIHLDTCFLSTMTSMTLWWNEQWQPKFSLLKSCEVDNHHQHPNTIVPFPWSRLVMHYVSITFASCCYLTRITNDWEIHRWMMEYREQEECIIYFQHILSFVGKGPSIWQHNNGNSLILSIVPGWTLPDYKQPSFEGQGIRISFDRQLNQLECSIALDGIELQWNWQMLQLCLDFQKSIMNMKDRLYSSSSNEPWNENTKEKYMDWSCNIQISTFRCCLLELSDIQVSPIIVLQGTLKYIDVKVTSSLSSLCIRFSTRRYKFGIESIPIDVEGVSSCSPFDGTNSSRNTSVTSDYSDTLWSPLTSPSCYVSKKHHSIWKGNDLVVKAQFHLNHPSFSIRIHNMDIQFSLQKYNYLNRWLKSWLPASKGTSQPVIPEMQWTVEQAKFIWMDQYEWDGLPLCRAFVSLNLQSSPLGGRLDVSIGVEIYNMIHLALEPFIEEWNATLHFVMKQDPRSGLGYFASLNSPTLSFWQYEIQFYSSRILQMNINPPMVATLYRLYHQVVTQPQSNGSHSLFSVSNRTGEIIELYSKKDIVQQLKDGQTVVLVDPLLVQRHFYLHSPFLSHSVRVELAFDASLCSFPVKENEQDIYMVVEKQVSGLHSLLEIRSNYFIQNDCDNLLWLHFQYSDSQEIESIQVERGEKRVIPLNHLSNGRYIRVGFSFLDDITCACSERSLLLVDWLQSCFQSNYLCKLIGCEEKDDEFVYCVAQRRLEPNKKDVVIHVMPLLCVKNYLGVDIYIRDDSLSFNGSLLPHQSRCLLYAMRGCSIRWMQTDEQFLIDWSNKPLKRKFQSRCTGNINSRSIAYTLFASSVNAWREIILYPDVIVSSPCLPMKEPNTAIYWQWIKSSNVWLWNTNDSNDCFALSDALCLPFKTQDKVSKLEFRLIWKDNESVYYSTIQRCVKGKHLIHWQFVSSSSSEENRPDSSFDNSILINICYQKWIEQGIIIPHAIIVPKYILENVSSFIWQLEWHDKCYILEQGSNRMMMLSEAMVHSNDCYLRLHDSYREEDNIHLVFSQVREMTSKGLNAIFPLKGTSPIFIHVQYEYSNGMDHFKILCVDCPPTIIRVINLSNSLFRICVGKNSSYGQYLLGNGQTISLQKSLIYKHSMYFYVVQSGKSCLVYHRKDISHSYGGFVDRQKRWIFYSIPRGPYCDLIIMEQGTVRKWEYTSVVASSSFLDNHSSLVHSRATFNLAGFGISLYSINNDEIVYTCLKKIRLQCNWTQDWYLWLSFALQDIHIDNQVTTIGRNYAVLMEKTAIEIPNNRMAMIQGRLGIWWKRMACDDLGLIGNWNILDELECSLQPCAFRLDSDVLESCIWWWIQTQEWTLSHSISNHPPSSHYSIREKTMAFVEEFQVSDIVCKVSFQFGRNGLSGLFHLPWYASSSLVLWERWIALFGLSIGSIEDAPLFMPSIQRYHIDWSSLVHDMSLFYKRNILWRIYTLMGSFNWFGNPNKCWKRIQFAWKQFFTSFHTRPRDLPILILKELVKLQCRMMDSWIEASVGMLQGTVDWLSSTLAYIPLKDDADVDQKVLYFCLHWSHRILVAMLHGMEYFQNVLSRWDNNDHWKPYFGSQRWRPIRLPMFCQPLQAFQYKDDMLGNWIFEHWNNRLVGMEKLVLFASLEDQFGMLWTNYRFVYCWYSVSIWKGGTKMSLENPRFVCLWELWHDQVLHIEKKDRHMIAFTWLPRRDFKKDSPDTQTGGMILVHQVACHDEELVNWWLIQLGKGLCRLECRKSLVHYSTLHPNGHTFPNLSGDM